MQVIFINVTTREHDIELVERDITPDVFKWDLIQHKQEKSPDFYIIRRAEVVYSWYCTIYQCNCYKPLKSLFCFESR